jgi:hypothetical protein
VNSITLLAAFKVKVNSITRKNNLVGLAVLLPVALVVGVSHFGTVAKIPASNWRHFSEK